MDYATQVGGQIGGMTKVSAPLTRARSLLSRLSTISGLLSEHVCTLEKVESLVVGAVPAQAQSAGRDLAEGDGFLSELEVVIASIESKMPDAAASAQRVKSAF